MTRQVIHYSCFLFLFFFFFSFFFLKSTTTHYHLPLWPQIRFKLLFQFYSSLVLQQKIVLFGTKIFQRLQKTIVKTSFFYSKSLPSTMTCQISTFCDSKMSLLKMLIIFVENVIFFFEENVPTLLFTTA